jgi:hypothetical protein
MMPYSHAIDENYALDASYCLAYSAPVHQREGKTVRLVRDKFGATEFAKKDFGSTPSERSLTLQEIHQEGERNASSQN